MSRTLWRCVVSLSAGFGLLALDSATAGVGEEPFALLDLVEAPSRCAHEDGSDNLATHGDFIYFVTPHDCDRGMGLWKVRKDGSGRRRRIARGTGEAPCGAIIDVENDAIHVRVGQFDRWDGCHTNESWFVDVHTERVERRVDGPFTPSSTPVIPGCPRPLRNHRQGQDMWECPNGLWIKEGGELIHVFDGSGDLRLSLVEEDGFFFFHEGADGSEIWFTDRTPEGTRRIAHPVGLYLDNLAVLGDTILVLAEAGESLELWRYDRSGEQPLRIAELEFATQYDRWIRPMGDVALLQLEIPTGESHPRERFESWVTDGTSAGTYLGTERRLRASFRAGQRIVGTVGVETAVLDLTTRALQTTNLYASQLFPFGDEAFLLASGDRGPALYRLDGAVPVTVSTLRRRFFARPYRPHVSDRAYFWISDELWASDGTSEGTKRLLSLDAPTRSSDPYAVGALGEEALVVTSVPTSNGDYDLTLWKTDGSQAGTHVAVRGGDSDGYDSLSEFLVTDDAVYFKLRKQAAKLTPTGGYLVQPDISLPRRRGIGAEIRNGLIVAGCPWDGECGVFHVEFETQTKTPLVVGPWCDEVIAARLPERVVFFTDDLLVSTDGTAAGTETLLDGLGSCGVRNVTLARVGDRVVVGCRGEDRWWSTAGTPETTFELNGSLPLDPRLWKTLFSTDDGLWRSDGTPEGTVRILDADDIGASVWLDGRLYFLRARDLWVSDGTEVGTRSLGPSPLPIGHLRAAAGRLVAVVDQTVWTWDPKEPLAPPRVLSVPAGIAYPKLIGGTSDHLLFRARTPETGVELLSVDIGASVEDSCANPLVPIGAKTRVRIRPRDGGLDSWSVVASLRVAAAEASQFRPEAGGLRIVVAGEGGTQVDRFLSEANGSWTRTSSGWTFRSKGERVRIRAREEPNGQARLTIRARLAAPSPADGPPATLRVAPIAEGRPVWCATIPFT